MLHIKPVPVQEEPVWHTFNIRRFTFREVPGWKVVRMCGRFWQFPPIGVENVPLDMIERVINDQEALRPVLHTMGISRSETTRSSQGHGVYWTGQHAFLRQQFPTQHVKTEVVVGELPRGKFRGIKITSLVNGQPCIYVLVTDKDVDLKTFYKYLYFYPKYISRRLFTEKTTASERVPYAIDMRLAPATLDTFQVVESF